MRDAKPMTPAEYHARRDAHLLAVDTSERDRIVDRMSDSELELYYAMGGKLPTRLRLRVLAIRRAECDRELAMTSQRERLNIRL